LKSEVIHAIQEKTKGFAFSTDRNVGCTGFRLIFALTENI